MELWWKIRGWDRYRLTSADCAGRLRELALDVQLENIQFENDLTAVFTVLRGERLRVREGDDLAVIGRGGTPEILAVVRRWWMVAVMAVFLGGLTLFLQGRMLFFQVQGNQLVPERLILAHAEECGVYFGASVRQLRSEQVKNHLLRAVPELKWAGVSISGCRAVITVAERQPGEQPGERQPGDVVACIDAVVTAVFPKTGTVLAVPGQAVRRGETLISGSADLGLLVRSDRAEGEVYGLTRRTVEAVLPGKTAVRYPRDRTVRKFSLRIGKKCVNFSNDSGILYGTCVKMRKVNDLTLPGGFVLPVALVTDTYLVCDTEQVSREISVEEILAQVRRYAREQMTAGAILSEESRLTGTALTAVLECREMIGAFRPGIYTEGDIHERENSERGAG